MDRILITHNDTWIIVADAMIDSHCHTFSPFIAVNVPTGYGCANPSGEDDIPCLKHRSVYANPFHRNAS
ncbi:MAG TPA: hypothetical protein QF901_10905, partial [Gammaproteobacteria bacterium]|nr:hypothetical protein [Gammaproteobacteria bacterium]